MERPLSRVELSRTAENALKGVAAKDMKLIRELLYVVAADPFDKTHTVKLHGEWEGHRRAKKGDWRVIYLPPGEGTIYVVYIRNRSEKTYKK